VGDAVDTRKIFKKAVHCFACEEDFYSTLSAIAQSERLACPCCGARIDLGEQQYRSLVTNVKQLIQAITVRP
jgi:DNA-directed RNA polymerase subunit RPC12/RpoP